MLVTKSEQLNQEFFNNFIDFIDYQIIYKTRSLGALWAPTTGRNPIEIHKYRNIFFSSNVNSPKKISNFDTSGSTVALFIEEICWPSFNKAH